MGGLCGKKDQWIRNRSYIVVLNFNMSTAHDGNRFSVPNWCKKVIKKLHNGWLVHELKKLLKLSVPVVSMHSFNTESYLQEAWMLVTVVLVAR